jgi:hypothetical protein
LLVSDFAAGLPLDEDPPLPAAGVDRLELLGVLLTGALAAGAGVVLTGALVTGAGVVLTAGVAAVGGADTERVVVLVLLAGVLSVKALAGGALTWGTSILIGEAALKTIGIGVPAAAAGTLGGRCSAGAAAGRSARPIAKQHANTAAPASNETTAMRT